MVYDNWVKEVIHCRTFDIMSYVSCMSYERSTVLNEDNGKILIQMMGSQRLGGIRDSW